MRLKIGIPVSNTHDRGHSSRSKLKTFETVEYSGTNAIDLIKAKALLPAVKGRDQFSGDQLPDLVE